MLVLSLGINLSHKVNKVDNSPSLGSSSTSRFSSITTIRLSKLSKV